MNLYFSSTGQWLDSFYYLICSNFLGALRLRIDKDNIVSQFIEESVILSVLIRSQTPYSLVNQNAFLTLWSAYINKDNCSLWSSYWHYLSLEVLIKKNNFPDSVADFSKRYSPDSWSLCGSSAQRDFESWIKSKGLVLKWRRQLIYFLKDFYHLFLR